MGPNTFTWFALFATIPIIGVLFWFMHPYRAAMVSYLAGWLLLPEATFAIKGLPNLDKYIALSTGVLLCMIVLDTGVFDRYRFHWTDLAMVLWCISPLFSSVDNGYGVYDGLSGIYTQTMYWGIPYFVGRVYFNDLARLRELGMACIIASLLYIPFILIELRMSPQLHLWTYGFRPTAFQHSIREGGYRPVGFVRGGLTLALFLAQSLVIAVVMWRTGSLKRLWILPAWVWILVLAVILVLCKSKGALILCAVAIPGYFIVSSTHLRWLFLAAIIAVPAYLVVRIHFEYDGQDLVVIAEEYLGRERAASLETRLDSEELLRDRAFEKPWFGWGGYGENRVFDDEGKDITITDSMWIIVLGIYGMVGMLAIFAAMLWPLIRTTWQVPGRLWADLQAGPAIGATIAVWMFVCDRLMNAQPNMPTVIMLGAIAGMPWRKIVLALDAERRARRAVGFVEIDPEPSPDTPPESSRQTSPPNQPRTAVHLS